jgi:hypothetical protein
MSRLSQKRWPIILDAQSVETEGQKSVQNSIKILVFYFWHMPLLLSGQHWIEIVWRETVFERERRPASQILRGLKCVCLKEDLCILIWKIWVSDTLISVLRMGRIWVRWAKFFVRLARSNREMAGCEWSRTNMLFGCNCWDAIHATREATTPRYRFVNWSYLVEISGEPEKQSTSPKYGPMRDKSLFPSRKPFIRFWHFGRDRDDFWSIKFTFERLRVWGISFVLLFPVTAISLESTVGREWEYPHSNFVRCISCFQLSPLTWTVAVFLDVHCLYRKTKQTLFTIPSHSQITPRWLSCHPRWFTINCTSLTFCPSEAFGLSNNSSSGSPHQTASCFPVIAVLVSFEPFELLSPAWESPDWRCADGAFCQHPWRSALICRDGIKIRKESERKKDWNREWSMWNTGYSTNRSYVNGSVSASNLHYSLCSMPLEETNRMKAERGLWKYVGIRESDENQCWFQKLWTTTHRDWSGQKSE